MTEQTHIKNALSRIIVEIAKREWPQEWQSMIADLNNIYAQGVTLHFFLSQQQDNECLKKILNEIENNTLLFVANNV